jgi:DNA repair exonuclease SbcCD ATPase subunit
MPPWSVAVLLQSASSVVESLSVQLADALPRGEFHGVLGGNEQMLSRLTASVGLAYVMNTMNTDNQLASGFSLENSPVELPSRSARQLLVDWANEQDGWVRQLVGEVLRIRDVVEGEALEPVFAQFLAESKLVDSDPQSVDWLESGQEGESVEADLMISSLAEVRGVNALSAGQRIEFNSNLTLLFGENGTGKTGYARILKQLSGSRTVETILPNVYDPEDTGWPRARVAYTLGGGEQMLDWTNKERVPALSRMAVFDTSAVSVHLDGDLSYVYTPGDLVLFPRVVSSISKLRSLLEELIAKRRTLDNPFLGRFTPGTRVSALMRELGAQTDPMQLFQLATVSEQEAAQLEPLTDRVNALQAQAIPAQLTVEQMRRERNRRIIAAATKILAFDSNAYNEAITDANEAEAEYSRLAAQLFAGAGVQGAKAEIWNNFLLAGEAYREHLSSTTYPQQGDACLYCRQLLGAEAAALISSYHEVATNATRARASAARSRAVALARDVTQIGRMGLTDDLSRPSTPAEGEEVLEEVSRMITALESQQVAINAGQAVQWDELVVFAQSLSEKCTATIAEVESLIADLSTKAEARVEALGKAKAQYAHLRDRMELKQCIQEVISYIDDVRWTQRAILVRSGFAKLQRSFTQTAKVAGEQFINGEFSKRFTNECVSLCAPTVRLEFPGRQGRTARQKTVARKHKPSAVLSEGEQRVIALADFLAEALMRPAGAPLVFDDPVTGLDRRRAGYIIDRLVELSAERQVIVFTHDIWFVSQLLEKLKDSSERCTYYEVLDQPDTGAIVKGRDPGAATALDEVPQTVAPAWAS